MFEEFAHPNVARYDAKVDIFMAKYQQRLDSYRRPNGQPLTDERKEELYLIKLLKVEEEADKKKNFDLYAFMERPVGFLQVNVPVRLPWAILHGERRTFEDYLFHFIISKDGLKVLFLLAGKPAGGSRPSGVTVKELLLWQEALVAAGFNWDHVGNAAAYRLKLKTPNYKNEFGDV